MLGIDRQGRQQTQRINPEAFIGGLFCFAAEIIRWRRPPSLLT
jgi:hypothetical protein